MRSRQFVCRFRLPMRTLLLLMAVVGWGVQYKTAHYAQDPSHGVSSGVPATLLDDGERTLRSDCAVAPDRSGPPVGLTSPDVPVAGFHFEPVLPKGGLLPSAHDGARKDRLKVESSFRAPPKLLSAFA